MPMRAMLRRRLALAVQSDHGAKSVRGILRLFAPYTTVSQRESQRAIAEEGDGSAVIARARFQRRTEQHAHTLDPVICQSSSHQAHSVRARVAVTHRQLEPAVLRELGGLRDFHHPADTALLKDRWQTIIRDGQQASVHLRDQCAAIGEERQRPEPVQPGVDSLDLVTSSEATAMPAMTAPNIPISSSVVQARTEKFTGAPSPTSWPRTIWVWTIPAAAPVATAAARMAAIYHVENFIRLLPLDSTGRAVAASFQASPGNAVQQAPTRTREMAGAD